MKEINIKSKLRSLAVPLLFMIISAIAIPISKYSGEYLISQVFTRLIRNLFLVTSLLIPIIAGMGINFGMILGAMAGQIGLIFIDEWGLVAKFASSFQGAMSPEMAKNLSGAICIVIAMLISVPISILLGKFAGFILNKAKGKEMITSMILGFFMIGVYQFFMLYICGGLIPFHNPRIVLPRGYGVRNTLKLTTARTLDKVLEIKLGSITIPVITLLFIIAVCVYIQWFKNTKLGQDMRAVGQDMAVSMAAGVNVDKVRTKAVVISTILAGFGQIIYIQNIGNLSVYNGADQAALFAAAALLVGGASAVEANIGHAIVGTAIFHLMFIVMPVAGKNITGQAALGEYFRMFISYGVVTLALIIHAWRRGKEADDIRKQFSNAQEN